MDFDLDSNAPKQNNIQEYIWNGNEFPIIKNESVKQIVRRDYGDRFIRHIYYLSDLHLDSKIMKEYGAHPTDSQLDGFIDRIVDFLFHEDTERDIFSTPNPIHFGSLVLLCGDVSWDFRIASLFLKQFAKRIRSYDGHLVYVLGNHELWYGSGGRWNPEGLSPDEIADIYRRFCRNNDIILLHNDLLLISPNDIRILDESNIMESTDRQIINAAEDSYSLILGGTGFSGKNPSFNATKGIYRGTIVSAEEDVQQTSRFRAAYERILDLFRRDKRVIVMTHNPPRDWSDCPPCPEWTYFHGHTHIPEFSFTEELKLFADNQWGYDGMSKMKLFEDGFNYDIFSRHPDGAYIITKEQYIDFLRRIGISSKMTREGTIIMLKQGGFYLFLLIDPTEKLYLLEGGHIHRMDGDTINSIYANMVHVASKLLSETQGIRDYIADVSAFVKGFGGSGKVHGCIVDIDFLNHLYVNIFDRTITPYYALDMVDKIVYPDVGSLLSTRRTDLIGKYEETEKKGNLPVKYNPRIRPDPNGTPYTDTDIYRASRAMMRIQYISENRVIRKWIHDGITDGPGPYGNVELTDLTSIERDLPPTRRPYSLSADSETFITHLDDRIIGYVVGGTISHARLKELIMETCGVLRYYELDDLDATAEMLLPQVCQRLESFGIRIDETILPHIPVEEILTLQRYSAPEQAKALFMLELDFIDRALEYLFSEEGEQIRPTMYISLTGKRRNDLKKLFRYLFTHRGSSTITKMPDGSCTLKRMDTEAINSIVDDYLNNRQLLKPLINETYRLDVGNMSTVRPPNAWGIHYSFDFLHILNLMSPIKWLNDAFKSLIFSGLLTTDEVAVLDAYAYVYGENSMLDSTLNREDFIFSTHKWIFIFDNKSLLKYLIANAAIFNCDSEARARLRLSYDSHQGYEYPPSPDIQDSS